MLSSTKPIRKCAVIGAGTMGAGIAAHMANAGADVVLLDLDAAVAARGIERQVASGGFMRPEFAGRVRAGSTRDDLDWLADRDWIVEAVAERLEIKQALFADIARVRKAGCIVSSNTSTIPLADLVRDVSPDLGADMLITHFFNPPRQMRLLELVAGPHTRPEAVARITHFLDEAMGKAIVPCKDTPGFIANRIGCFWLAAGLGEALRLGIDVARADAVMGRPFGLPRTGVFGLYDLIGIDLMPGLIRSLQGKLPATDAIHRYQAEPDLVTRMIGQGLTGRKGGGGFYRRRKDGTREVIGLADGAYRDEGPLPDLPAEAREALDLPGVEGAFAWAVMSRTLAYAASLVPEIAERPDLVDRAMCLGYGWRFGPFELIDRLGPAWFADRLARDGQVVPDLVRAAGEGTFYRVTDGAGQVLAPAEWGAAYVPVPEPRGTIALPALRRAGAPVWSDAAASLWDIGDGIGLFEFHTRLNVFTPALIAATGAVAERAPRDFRGLVIANDGPVFSAGADLKAMLAMADAGDRAGLAEFLDAGQQAFARLAAAPVPVVGAASALAVGGGCEVLLHAHRLVLHAEARIGLVESRVGLLPGWGGVAQWLLRHRQAGLTPEDAAISVLRGVVRGIAATGAHDARAEHLLRAEDGIVMNPDHVIARAKAAALDPGSRCAEDEWLVLPPRAALDACLDALSPTLAPHDRVIAGMLADLLSGDGQPITLAALTRGVTGCFVDLAVSQAGRARMRYMIETGKPLEN